VKSIEYPDLLWIPPKSWTNANRSAVQLVVIHTTEGSARPESAEDGAAYDARRTDGTSAHYFHDSNSTVQCVHTADQAHTARAQGNKRGIHHELCTTVKRAGTWDDEYHAALLRQAARQAARDARKWNIPIRKLSAAQVAAGVKGFCGHADITQAFPQDGGTHTDPGKSFPWSRFIALVSKEAGFIDDKDDDMDASEVAAEVVKQLMARRIKDAADPERSLPWETWIQYTDARRNQILAAVAKTQATAEKILANVQMDDNDREILAAQIDARAAELLAELKELQPVDPTS